MDLQKLMYEAFKSQNQESGLLDVTFVIDGKKLYAHKCVLGLLSTTFASMISERWTSKDVPIPLDTYSYDDFFQFLLFLYSEECLLTDDNISSMVDIAEFYQVAGFKDYCQKYLMNVEKTTQNVIQLFDIAMKYSLVNFKKSIVPYIKTNFFVLDEFWQLSKNVLLAILQTDQPFISDDEEIFEKVYEWAKKQAIPKKELNPNLNLTAMIKKTLDDFLPLFDFTKMDHKFVNEFVVGKSLLPPHLQKNRSFLDLIADGLSQVIVKITDANGRIMKGRFYDNDKIYDDIQSLANVNCQYNNAQFEYCIWETTRERPPRQRNSRKNDEKKWYLSFDDRGNMRIKKMFNRSCPSDAYLIAEMIAEENFVTSKKCIIRAIRF